MVLKLEVLNDYSKTFWFKPATRIKEITWFLLSFSETYLQAMYRKISKPIMKYPPNKRYNLPLHCMV